MKKFLIVAGVGLLSACNSNEPEPVAIEEETVMVEEDAPSMAGTYDGTTEEGGTWTSVLNEDGTYEDTTNGGITEAGTWAMVGEQVRFYRDVEEGGEDVENCYSTTEPAEDGTMTVTNTEGESWVVTKVS
jgi:hypothetical protein